MKRSWIFIGALAASYWLFVPPAHALPETKPTFPRLANYFLHWTISDDEARALAKFDLVVIDAEAQERSSAQLKEIRRLNPNIILLAYVPASEVRRDVTTLQSIAPVRYKLGAHIPDDWYLKDSAGSRMSFWPGTWIVDVTGPWQEHLAQFVAREILGNGIWDGVMYDNTWDDIVHFAHNVPDLNHDGAPDDADIARASWQESLRGLYRRTAELSPDKFIFENDGPMYASSVHGVLLESFPRKGWVRHVDDVRQVRRVAKDPAIPILNANTFNTGARDDFRAMRFGLATALTEDAYYSFDFGDQDHGQTWLYDEYSVFLGEAIAPRRGQATSGSGLATGAVWRRDFEKGIVFVNTGDTARSVTLPIEVEKVHGVQDITVNDGAITRTLTVGGRDGLIVFRPLTTIAGAPFENGVFARVFSASGEPLRAGFFALDRQERSGIILASVDLDGDGKVEKIKWTGKGETIAIGDVTGHGVKEIVVAGAGQVRVERVDGTLVTAPFFPFGPRYKGALNVAVGDLNGDGFSEIVVGAGAGGGPAVRIFSGSGRLLSGGFFAYDPRFRGGVRVAVGDVDNDGTAEIVTGPGVGGGPQVRVFNSKGQAVGSGFFAFDQSSREGVTPIVTDIDGDGKNEIVAVTKDVM